MSDILKMEKPKKPVRPEITNLGKYPRGVGYEYDEHGKTLSSPFIKDYQKYLKDLMQYKIDYELYEQIKLIKLIKAANPKLILKKYKIIKASNMLNIEGKK